MIKRIKSLTNTEDKKRLMSNFFSLSVLQAFSYILPLITLPYLVHVVGVDKLGLIMFAMSFIMFFNIFVEYGFQLSATREISLHRDNKEKLTEIFSAVMSVKMILVVVAFVLLSIIIFTFDKFSHDWEIYYLTFLWVVGNAIFPIWYFQGREEMKFITIINILSRLLFAMLLFTFVHTKEDYIYVPLLNGLGTILAGIISLWLVYSKLNQKFEKQQFKMLKIYFNNSSHFFLSGISQSIYTVANTFILGIFTNTIMVGYYSIAEKLYQAMLSFYWSLSQVIYPHIVKHKNIQFFKKLFTPIIIFNIIVISILYAFDQNIFNLLFSNHTSKESLEAFRLLLIASLIIVPSIMLGYPLLGAFGYAKDANNSVITGSIFHLSTLAVLSLFGKISIYSVSITVIMTEIVILSYKLYKVKSHRLWHTNGCQNDFNIINDIINNDLIKTVGYNPHMIENIYQDSSRTNFKLPSHTSLEFILVKLIFFFGPTGMFFIFFLNIGSFRLFYILSTILIGYKLLTDRTYNKNLLLVGSLLILVTFISTLIGLMGPATDETLAANPIVRMIVIFMLFFSFYIIFFKYLSNYNAILTYQLYKSSLYGFLLVLALGLILFGLYLTGKISQDIYANFTTLYQEAYGYVRLSPGTYPNEFGVLGSFFSILSILFYIVEKKKIYIYISLICLVGVLLATTRAAYLIYMVSLLWMLISFGTNFRLLKFTSILIIGIGLMIILLNQYFQFDFMGILNTSIDSIANNEGSSKERVDGYIKVANLFLNSPFFGLGFESNSVSMLHNLPLQLFFGYGIIFSLLILILLFIFIKLCRAKAINSVFMQSINNNYNMYFFFKNITIILGIHVLLFGLTNHNQSHFLTWIFFGQLLILKYSKTRNNFSRKLA